ncbi:MAG: serine protease [Acidobacteriota bacterium]
MTEIDDPRDTQWFLDRMPSKEVLDSALRGDPVKRLLNIVTDRAIVNIGLDPVARPEADKAEVDAALNLAASAARRLTEGGANVTLTSEEKVALELFILLVARPAIFVQNGTVAERPENWKEIGRDADLLPRIIAGVGRIESAAGAKKGTGFLVAGKRILTNNHVLCALFDMDLSTWSSWPQKFAQLCKDHSKVWEEDETLAPLFELRGELGSTASSHTRIRKILGHHSAVDVAVLELEADPAGSRKLPLLGTEPESLNGRRVYAVGFPIQDSGVTPVHVFQRVFGSDPASLGTKRFSPGTITQWNGANSFGHDASTLPGSSGSAIVDFEHRRVLGIHFSGTYKTRNFAVPLWKFREDPLFAGNGIVFG